MPSNDYEHQRKQTHQKMEKENKKKMKKKYIYLASIDDMHINWFMFITIQGDTEHDRE